MKENESVSWYKIFLLMKIRETKMLLDKSNNPMKLKKALEVFMRKLREID